MGRGLAGVGRTAGGPGEHKGGALWQRCRFWGAWGGPTCGTAPAGRPLCTQLGDTVPPGREGWAPPSCPVAPISPRYLPSHVSRPLPRNAAAPQAGPDGPGPSSTHLPRHPLHPPPSPQPLPSARALHPKTCLCGKPPCPGRVSGTPWALAGTGLRSRGHPVLRRLL